MAAFAVNLKAIAAHPGVKMGYKTDQKSRSAHGYMESNFLQSLGVTRKSVECRGADHEVCTSVCSVCIMVRVCVSIVGGSGGAGV